MQFRTFITAVSLILAVFLISAPLSAATTLSIKAITWDVIGLDSNKPSTDGPVDFPLAVRVKNTGTEVATNVMVAAELSADGNQHLNLIGLDTITTPSLAVGQVADFYFHVRIDRPPGNNNAQTAGYFSVLGNQATTKRYVVTAVASNAPPVMTPNNRQLFVEKILSQNRNSVAPTLTVDNPEVPFLADQVRTFTLFSDTATGYDQQETSINFPNDIFQILSVKAVYTDPACGCNLTNEDQHVEDPLLPTAGRFTTDKVYVDGCGWVTDFNNAGYMTSNNSCSNDPLKTESPTGKIGGTIITTYKVKVLQNVTMQVDLDYLVHDHSGSSFHYNFEDDFFQIIPTNILVAKTAPTDPVEAGDEFTYMISVCNDGATEADDVVLTDTLPSCINYVSADPSPTATPSGLLVWDLGTIDPGLGNCVEIEITATATCDLGPCVNTATVATSDYETDYTDNEDTAEITIVDTTPPEITCPQDATLECPADTGPTAQGTPSASDNCINVDVTHSDVFTPACGETGVLVRTWTATDDAGNQNTCDQTITIVDTTNPTIADLPDRTIECGGSTAPNGEPTASDTCGDVTVTYTDGPMSDLCGNTGAFTRTWKATDECGNMATSEQLITVVDTTPPTIADLPDRTIECGNSTAPNGEPTASDTCGSVVVTYTDGPMSDLCGNTGAFTRTWKATDDCGNMATSEQLITVVDTTPPTIADLPDRTIECGNSTAPNGEPTASDTCGGVVVTYTDGPMSDLCGNTGAFTRTWKATDDCGNMATSEQLITVVDTTPPTIADLPDRTVECGGSTAPNGEPTASDTCGSVVVTYTDGPITMLCGNNVRFTRTWKATDACGNMATSQQVITTEDTTPPTIADLPDRTIECGNSTDPNGEPTASDTCGDVTVTYTDSTPSDGCGNTGAFTRTWKATDECGNMATSEQLITVVDTTPPSVTCPEDITVPATGACVVVDYPDVSATDNCGTANVTFDPAEGYCFPCGTTTQVTVTATDECGNTSSCTFDVTVGPCPDGCALTQGYWKNHPEDWPVESLTLGNRSYTKAECIMILQTPVKKNGLIALAHQLIAAKLNVLEFADSSCISTYITQADALIGNKVIPPIGGGKLTTKQASFLNNILDDFNNARLCAPHCDDVETNPVSFKIY